MKVHRFFNHENPFNAGFRTLSDRMNSFEGEGFHGFLCFGENIADYPIIKANERFYIENKNRTSRLFSTDGREIFPNTYFEYAQRVVEGWMNSPGHRENILNPDYKYLGCGSACYDNQRNGYSMLYFKLTQNFGGGLVSVSFLNGMGL
jgi:uncharacterized protein YkwD